MTSTFRGISRTGLSYVSASISSTPPSCTKNCVEAKSKSVAGLAVGITTSILILGLIIILLIAVLLIYSNTRKSAKQNPNLEHQDGPELQLEANANPYEQVRLSEFIPSAENEAINNSFWQPQADLQGIYSCIDTEHPSPKSVTQVTEKTIFDNPTYATVDNSRIENSKKQHINDRQYGLPVPLNGQHFTTPKDEASSLVENESKLVDEAMYAVVNKKRKEDEDTDAPPVPPHTVEELYTAVAKTSKVKATDDKHKALQLPLPTLMTEKQDTVVEKDTKDRAENEEVPPPLPPHTVEELYTAVIKKPMTNVEAEEVAPPIPPYTIDTAVKKNSKDKGENEEVTPSHTVEEPYTAVMKKESAEDEEEAPPIPPYMANL